MWEFLSISIQVYEKLVLYMKQFLLGQNQQNFDEWAAIFLKPLSFITALLP
jgi:hypothetical protein